MGLKMDKYELQIAAIDVPPDPLGEMMDVHGLGYCTKEEASAEMAKGRDRWVSLDDNIVGTTYTVEGLLPASGYMFVVRGHDPEFGWPDFLDIPESNVVYTEGTTPNPLFGLEMTEISKTPVPGRAVSNHHISIAWQHGRVNGDAIDNYEIMWMCEETAVTDLFLSRRRMLRQQTIAWPLQRHRSRKLPTRLISR